VRPPLHCAPLNDEADIDAQERVGSVLNDKWTLERLLGVGGMAAVYAGLHRNGARAAIKVLHPGLARNKEVRERFQREGYAANKVTHPGVVRVLDDDVVSDGPDTGTAYLVMELLEGESLQDRVERGQPIGEREFLEIADGVLDALRAAHDCGVVHRDLKPENLFFARMEDGATRIKVLDFGLARLLQGQAITSYGLALGTPSFMSPEQAAGKTDEIDGRTDLFALAATGFRLRTGRRIHEADGAIELVQKMSNLPAPPIRSVAPDVSEPYARIIDRALQFKREDRYESAGAMQADVRRALAELGAPAEPAPATKAAPPPTVPPRPQLPVKSSEPTIELSEGDIVRPPAYGLDESIRIPKRRSILPWLALLLIAGGAAWFYVRRTPSDSTDAAASASAPTPSSSAAPDASAPRLRPPQPRHPPMKPPPTSSR
jgi:serine/threonine protein kinase